MEAHPLKNRYNTADYNEEVRPIFIAGYPNFSPNTHSKVRSFVRVGNQSSFVSTHPKQMAGVQDYREITEQHHPRKYHQRHRPSERDAVRQFDESEFDEREAQMYSSMSQADLKDHIVKNTNFEEHDQKDETQIIIDQLYKKFAKISSQYCELLKQVKQTDYIRGYDTSVSYSKMKELESIESKFNHPTHHQNTLLNLTLTATKEIDDMYKQEYSEFPIENFVKFVKKQFTEVFLK